MRNNSTSAEFIFNHPGQESRIVNITKSAIPATPPLKGGETYLVIYQIIIVVFVIKIFLKLTALPWGIGGKFYH